MLDSLSKLLIFKRLSIVKWVYMSTMSKRLWNGIIKYNFMDWVNEGYARVRSFRHSSGLTIWVPQAYYILIGNNKIIISTHNLIPKFCMGLD